MSFKIFTLQLFGGLKSIETIEKKRTALLDDYIECNKIEKSEELKRYLELEKEVNSDEFRKKKTDIEKLRFKGSKEHKQLLELKKLEKKKTLKKYLAVAESADLKRFDEIDSSEKSAEFFALDKYVNDGNYARDKKSENKEEAENKYNRFKQLQSDTDIKFYLKFKKSALYKNYIQVLGSADLKKLYELRKITSSGEFKTRRAYLEDKKRWEKTEESAREKEFLDMKNQAHFINYFKNKSNKEFDFFKEWQIVFADDFKNKSLDNEKWSTKGFVAEKILGDNYGISGDNHFFTDGHNISINGKMSIQVKKEKTQGKLWQMPAGFIPAEMDYSSGLISSWNSFWMEDGILEAKIKFNPAQQVVSSFYLSGEKDLPRVNLLEMGAKNRLGVLNVNGTGKADVHGLDISNLKKDKWYIFTIVKDGQNYTWKINDKEVLTINSPALKEKLHVNASSIVVKDVPGQSLPVGFDIQWVRCYQKNSVIGAN